MSKYTAMSDYCWTIDEPDMAEEWSAIDTRIAKLEAQLAEANERAEKAAQDGWLKTAETQLARAKKAEAQLDESDHALDCMTLAAGELQDVCDKLEKSDG